MIPAPIPENEQKRQRWLDELQILGTQEEQTYDDLTFLAAQICQMPIALVSQVDRDHQWFKSHQGWTRGRHRASPPSAPTPTGTSTCFPGATSTTAAARTRRPIS